MLFSIENRKHLKYLINDKKNSGMFVFVDDGSATEQTKKYLTDLDADYFEIYGYHMITNYKELETQLKKT